MIDYCLRGLSLQLICSLDYLVDRVLKGLEYMSSGKSTDLKSDANSVCILIYNISGSTSIGALTRLHLLRFAKGLAYSYDLKNEAVRPAAGGSVPIPEMSARSTEKACSTSSHKYSGNTVLSISLRTYI